jgi:hypothetical protein
MLARLRRTTNPPVWDTAKLLEFHRVQFGNAQMTTPAGGDAGAGGAGDAGAGTGDAGAAGSGAAGQGSTGDTGQQEPDFPPNTPVAEMTDKQAAAYWKHQSRRHETTAKGRADYDALKAKAAQYDALEQASKTEHERALDEAKKEAKAEGEAAAATALRPHLVRAEFKAAAAGRIVDAEGRLDSKRLDALLDPLDMSRFLTDAGEVDTAKVLAFIDTAAPKQDGKRTGFPDLGQGRRQGAPSPSVASGQALYEQRHKKQTANT